MICVTVRNGQECLFMTAKGCSYNGGICHEIVEQCNGCGRGIQFESGWYCSATPQPATKWRNSNCNLATHVQAVAAKTTAKLNPIKASKRKGR